MSWFCLDEGLLVLLSGFGELLIVFAFISLTRWIQGLQVTQKS
ncbi:hypothetical protein HDF14_002229 [Edaphobacter lichenicola]|jgi:hypothetical protein|uniref:Uncharacterized protein n=1 Tax=Tunturiibacter gelidiferens TaxID=3069689 RepID=A0A9X0QE55_9BACT|nr:hypothetical protein [Edaphobacter lichenicola]